MASRKNADLKILGLETFRKLSSFFGEDDDDWPSGAAGVTSLGSIFNVKPKG